MCPIAGCSDNGHATQSRTRRFRLWRHPCRTVTPSCRASAMSNNERFLRHLLADSSGYLPVSEAGVGTTTGLELNTRDATETIGRRSKREWRSAIIGKVASGNVHTLCVMGYGFAELVADKHLNAARGWRQCSPKYRLAEYRATSSLSRKSTRNRCYSVPDVK